MHSTCITCIVVLLFSFSVQCSGEEISWRHVVDLYYRDTAKPAGLRQVPKLKYEHINLTSFSKMRVDLAAQVMFQTDNEIVLYLSNNA